jgi:hypothetical protein
MNKHNRAILAGIVSGMMISEVLGEFFKVISLDAYGLWITFFIYTPTIVYLAIQKDKEGEASE